MLARLSSRFNWLGMTQDCERWVAACMECRSRKSVQDHRAGFPAVVPRAVQPGDFVGMDLVGPFTKSPSGNTYLLTMHCHFSRFPAAIQRYFCAESNRWFLLWVDTRIWLTSSDSARPWKQFHLKNVQASGRPAGH